MIGHRGAALAEEQPLQGAVVALPAEDVPSDAGGARGKVLEPRALG